MKSVLQTHLDLSKWPITTILLIHTKLERLPPSSHFYILDLSLIYKPYILLFLLCSRTLCNASLSRPVVKKSKGGEETFYYSSIKMMKSLAQEREGKVEVIGQ